MATKSNHPNKPFGCRYPEEDNDADEDNQSLQSIFFHTSPEDDDEEGDDDFSRYAFSIVTGREYGKGNIDAAPAVAAPPNDKDEIKSLAQSLASCTLNDNTIYVEEEAETNQEVLNYQLQLLQLQQQEMDQAEDEDEDDDLCSVVSALTMGSGVSALTMSSCSKYYNVHGTIKLAPRPPQSSFTQDISLPPLAPSVEEGDDETEETEDCAGSSSTQFQSSLVAVITPPWATPSTSTTVKTPSVTKNPAVADSPSSSSSSSSESRGQSKTTASTTSNSECPEVVDTSMDVTGHTWLVGGDDRSFRVLGVVDDTKRKKLKGLLFSWKRFKSLFASSSIKKQQSKTKKVVPPKVADFFPAPLPQKSLPQDTCKKGEIQRQRTHQQSIPQQPRTVVPPPQPLSPRERLAVVGVSVEC
jgi:hypothetical protein